MPLKRSPQRKSPRFGLQESEIPFATDVGTPLAVAAMVDSPQSIGRNTASTNPAFANVATAMPAAANAANTMPIIANVATTIPAAANVSHTMPAYANAATTKLAAAGVTSTMPAFVAASLSIPKSATVATTKAYNPPVTAAPLVMSLKNAPFVASPITSAAAAAAVQQGGLLTSLQQQVAALQHQLSIALARIAEVDEGRHNLNMAKESVSSHSVSFLQKPQTATNIHTHTDFAAEQYHTQSPLLTPSYNTNCSVPSQSMTMVAQRKIIDLPEFSGEPEDWPSFFAAYTESSAAFGYSNFENNQRLRKSLKGVAKETVRALLIQPDNVGAVIEQLRIRFGRSDQLIRSQLKLVREAPNISEGALAKLIPFATLTSNLTVFLQSMGEERHLSNPTLLEELVSKLPISKRMEWARYATAITPYPTIINFNTWLSELARLVQMIDEPESRENKRRPVLHAANERQPVCTICQGLHKIRECQQFKDSAVSERWQKVKRLRLCFSCLNAGHITRDCRRRKTCSTDGCMKNHHRLLHESRVSGQAQTEAASACPVPVTSYQEPPRDTNPVLNCSAERIGEVLFRVLPVTLYGPKRSINTYALLDEGSSITMMHDTLLNELGLHGQHRDVDIQWFGGRGAREPAVVVDVKVSGVGRKKIHWLYNVHSVSKLSLPSQSLRVCDIPNGARHKGKLPMQPYSNVVPTVLIGLDHSHLGLPTHAVCSRSQGPYAAHTELGWVVFGPIINPMPKQPICLHVSSNRESQLHDLVAEYFSTESFGVKPSPPVESAADMRAKEILEQTITKVNKQYQLGLLWKSDDIKLPDSYTMATQRLVGIERKMKRNPEFATAYCSMIQGYIDKGYARKLEPHEKDINNHKTWYIPHFAVESPGKRIRLVFDCAAAVNGISLNSCLLKGPQQYRPLPSVLYHFREGAVGVCADIKEMFHQVIIQPEDRSAQRFIWRGGDSSRQPDVYEMTAMTFVAACSPCAAHFVKIKNAMQYIQQYPRAVKAITDYHYVDDFVDSFESTAEAIEVAEQVREIHRGAHFELHKFSSSSPEVAAKLGGKATALQIKSKNSKESEKVLGMLWQPSNDTFSFKIQFHGVDTSVVEGTRCPTKRELLSIVMSIFDPLGFLCHFTITAKFLLRQLWKREVCWDEPVPAGISALWHQFRQELPNVVNSRIPRHYFQVGLPHTLQLHIFVDASEEAFAAVAYWRTQTIDNSLAVSLVTAKSRSAPLKQLTIPRLELQAAVLGTRLMKLILEEHTVQVDRCVLWSDSTTVLKWIASEHRRYKPFVAHRVAEILNATQPSQWRWISTNLNVADEATRPGVDKDLTSSSRWFSGPSFLLEEEHLWPKDSLSNSSENADEELRPKLNLMVCRNAFFKFDRFSSLLRLKRVAAWVIRFITRCRKRYVPVPEYGLSADEINAAEQALLRQVQLEGFANEIRILQRGDYLPRDSELHQLMPYLDSIGLIRAKGRIDAGSWIPHDTRRPIILPSVHPYTKLVVFHEHKLNMHQNTEATVCALRSRFWIPRLRKVLRNVITNCNTCRINKAKPNQPIMGMLPEDRITPYVRPFTFTGLDYFGPVSVTVGRRVEKRWVALFTCLTIRAIHLEVVYDLSTDACVLAMRNFMNRRGVPKRIRSDNGKNFVGAENEMKRFSDVFDCQKLQGELSAKGVEWKFNCPANPSEGGAWERMVQCVKRVLRHTMKEITPKEYTLQSLVIEAENVVNSRPLTHLPITPEQDEPLTPNHFLLGTANTAQTDIDTPPLKLCAIRKQWRIARQLRDRFWKRWVSEYLPTLTRREKWCQPTKPLEKGDLVFICDVNVPRKDWRRGIVENVYPGADGETRRADVRTSVGLARRPASKLAVLDVSVCESDTIHGVRDVDDE